MRDFQLGQRLYIRDLQYQAAHAGVAAAGPVSRFRQARQAVSHQRGLQFPQFVAHGAASALVLDWALAWERFAYPFFTDRVLSGKGSGGHPPVVEVHKVVGIDTGDEFTGPGGVGARPGVGGVVEEVGAHGRDCTGFFGFGWWVGGVVISRRRC